MANSIDRNELDEEKRFYEKRSSQALKEITTIEDRKKFLEQKKQLLMQENKSCKFVKTFQGIAV